ncbi:hypothetical protein Ahy_A07g037000 [Arachis hypogaea]|uniref:Transposase MuDR plant domain-containing protein n=1 Tax=Arachis hypogaea TaxID=3818 RepID=A0A445CHJ1_ARAHY|nr:hypothetical protein Ahy_A07g037000 [Arachis hypogaea]
MGVIQYAKLRCVKKVGLVYYNGEVIPNTHEGVTFVCECPLSFAILCTMSFVDLQNGLCNNINSHISKRVSNILYRNPVQVFGGLINFRMMPITDDASMQRMLCIYQQNRFHVLMIELYVEFEQQSGLGAVSEEVNVDELEDIDWKEDNNDSEEEFEANYEVDDKNDDGDLAGNPVVQNEADAIVSQYPFGVPLFMQTLDLEAIHAPKFPENANMGEGNAAAEDGEFRVKMEFGSRESVISTIKSYTIARGVDYTVYESELQTFYAKCKGYGAGCDWLIRASLIRKKACWEFRRYNGKHTYTMGTISQDHVKLDSHVIAETIRLLVEADPTIKVKSIIAEVQSRFNYITLPVWLKTMTVKMPRHIGSNFLRRFKAPYLHKLVVNTSISFRCYGPIHSYSRTEQEYNKNYQRLKEWCEAYTQWCNDIGVERWVLALDGGHHWGHMMTNLVECINSVLKGARNLHDCHC